MVLALENYITFVKSTFKILLALHREIQVTSLVLSRFLTQYCTDNISWTMPRIWENRVEGTFSVEVVVVIGVVAGVGVLAVAVRIDCLCWCTGLWIYILMVWLVANRVKT
ncbi:hypothetical protein BDP27DRAFT_1343174 [Rhodocollybia butyracea]|uniref:Uncharacterized protein n=1 Tax=Rhodocollybia butyracea TaxID=206335 RepID=A0A9P5TXV7_9AGAR|nr:hypothetical protein BDP27DRAFT_1343174 [Rhodocollybia butyracea]